MISLAFGSGFATSAALIVAIGAQNAFVLRQGLARAHVLPVVLVCALSDALLISLGIAGLGALVQASPLLLDAARYGGAAFLLVYGALAARRALSDHALAARGAATTDLRAALAACLAFTYLNPHCWLDTVVLLGAVAAQQPPGQQASFGSGAMLASATWFFALGYGARLLAPLFARPLAWRLLDGAIALVMGAIAMSLLVGR
ncbi:MAG: amino acid transporter [Piscinibacter sp.]|nr:amino acid transporter [Piscinibacter sp.]